jgi:hypothetical protein
MPTGKVREHWLDWPDVYSAPGPWWWENHPDNDKTIALSARGGDVLLATGDGQHSWLVVSKANARLIEAAPDLLAACQLLLETWGSQSHDGIEAANKAIAKIKG